MRRNDRRILGTGLLFSTLALLTAYPGTAQVFQTSHDNPTFLGRIGGPQVVEVRVDDPDIDAVDEPQTEPVVLIGGSGPGAKRLRMTQATDGRWYGYFADRDQALIADSTAPASSNVSARGMGLDFGTFCAPSEGAAVGLDDILGITDTEGIAIPSTIGADGEEIGAFSGQTVSQLCAGLGTPFLMNMVRASLDPSAFPTPPVDVGQIGVRDEVWPFVQLFDLESLEIGLDLSLVYTSATATHSIELRFESTAETAGSTTDRTTYPPGAEVHLSLFDMWLNMDPTDEDSWTFATNADAPSFLGAYYAIFDDDGGPAGDDVVGGAIRLDPTILDQLMCQDNCLPVLAPGNPAIVLLQDNADSEIFGFNPFDPLSFQSASGQLPPGSVPITFTETGPNTGIFESTDPIGVSNTRITPFAPSGFSAAFDYNGESTTISTGFVSGSLDIVPNDEVWNSGEPILIRVIDDDLNLNTRQVDTVDVSDPDVEHIPTLRTGNPVTLGQATGASINDNGFPLPLIGFQPGLEDIEAESDRLILRNPIFGSLPVFDDSDITIDLGITFGDLQSRVPEPGANAQTSGPGGFVGVDVLNFDLQSIFENADGIDDVDLIITDGTTQIPIDTGGVRAGTIRLPQQLVSAIHAVDPAVVASLILDIETTSPASIPIGAQMPIVADFFSFGFFDDGTSADRVANQIIRLELEETGEDTGIFEGSLEHTMVNQLTILDEDIYDDLSTIADDVTFVLIEDLTDEDAPRVNYLEILSDGLPSTRTDAEDAPSHSSSVFFDSNDYVASDIVTITLEDHDLNTDLELIDMYETVGAGDEGDPAFGTVGRAGLPEFSFGPLGRLLEVTFDDVRWETPQGTCDPSVFDDDTGLDDANFSLVETDVDSGIFVGSFEIPDRWCRDDDGSPETTAGLELGITYVDFRDATGQIIEVTASAPVPEPTGSAIWASSLVVVVLASRRRPRRLAEGDRGGHGSVRRSALAASSKK